MPSSRAVIWINDPSEISAKIDIVVKTGIANPTAEALEWFREINKYPADQASFRIWKEIRKISDKCT